MTKKIKTAGVIGAGVMGATIAAQLANVGIETILLDIVLSEPNDTEKKKGLTKESRAFRNKLAQNGVQNSAQGKTRILLYSGECKKDRHRKSGR